ncbi:MAG TPA: hypothetical protein VFG23_23980 [Polyangia bacterium]|nr:hypothetical protein [Polyangia bacterium]
MGNAFDSQKIWRLAALLAGWCAACGSGSSGSGTGGKTGAAGAVGSAGHAGGAGTGDAGTGGSVAGTSGSGGASTGTGGTGTAGTVGTGGAGGAGGSTAGSTGTGTGGSGPGGSQGGSSGGGGGGGVAALGCAGKTYKLCEDFETGTVGGLPTGWTALDGYGGDAAKGVGLANDQFRSGGMSLKSDSMTPGEERIQRSLASLGATATKHWGRIFYKVQSPAPLPASGAVIHVTLTALEGTTENRVVDTVEASNGTHQFLFNVPDDSCCNGSAYSWSFDANWHCAEWYVDVSSNSYRFFTDNTEVTSLAFTGNTTAKMSNYTSVAVGAEFYQTPPSPFVIWFDDLAIDDNQIHCQ